MASAPLGWHWPLYMVLVALVMLYQVARLWGKLSDGETSFDRMKVPDVAEFLFYHLLFVVSVLFVVLWFRQRGQTQ